MVATILCVEDNPQNMRLVRKMLNSAGYQVIEAQDGESGYTTILEQRPDLVLMDVNLPDIDGLQVTSAVKALPDYSHIPIIALTANAMHGDRERCLEAGCNGYVPKPVTKNELLSNVAYYLEQAERRTI
ncbi:MAG: response regulator [Chloroflexi bacterium]|nr:response regulator [Chloroflexota bacterium]